MKRRSGFVALVGAAALGAGVLVTAAGSGATSPTPGSAPEKPLPAAINTSSANALKPFITVAGRVSLSVDAFGSNQSAPGVLKAQKNAGATVLRAFLMTAATGFTGYTPTNSDVTLDGHAVTYDPSHTISNSIASHNVLADVTSIVKPKLDAAPAGLTSFTYVEAPGITADIDGSILAVILNDPSRPVDNTVALLYGAQNTAGDDFNIGLANPINKADPNVALNMSLGISYGYQATGQFSDVDVNGTRMSSSAGGQDDCYQKNQPTPNFRACGNGELITAGGIGDLNDNPPNPTATDGTCSGHFGPAPRCDDELYSLLPFVHTGDTAITVHTLNPSNDDNIMFAGFELDGVVAVVGEGATLSPATQTETTGGTATLTAKVLDGSGHPVSGRSVTLKGDSGPNAGLTQTGTTGAGGTVTFTYSSATAGVDSLHAEFLTSSGVLTFSNSATVSWKAATKLRANPVIANVLPSLDIYLAPSAVLTTTSGAPVPGETIRFSAGGSPICSAVTGGDGTAKCSGLLTGVLPSVLALGYQASFAGDATHGASSAKGTILSIDHITIL